MGSIIAYDALINYANPSQVSSIDTSPRTQSAIPTVTVESTCSSPSKVKSSYSQVEISHANNASKHRMRYNSDGGLPRHDWYFQSGYASNHLNCKNQVGDCTYALTSDGKITKIPSRINSSRSSITRMSFSSQCGDSYFNFDVADFFMLGSPIVMILIMRILKQHSLIDNGIYFELYLRSIDMMFSLNNCNCC